MEENRRGAIRTISNRQEEDSFRTPLAPTPELIKGPILVERWTYNLGSNQFTRYLFFQNGKLYKIERGDK